MSYHFKTWRQLGCNRIVERQIWSHYSSCILLPSVGIVSNSPNLVVRHIHNDSERSRPPKWGDFTTLNRRSFINLNLLGRSGGFLLPGLVKRSTFTSRNFSTTGIMLASVSTQTQTDEPVTTTSSESVAEAAPILEVNPISVVDIGNGVNAAGSAITEEILTIPDAPIPETLTFVETAQTVVLNAAGEPSIASLGLGGWYPPGLVRTALEFLHADIGLPWWGAILAGTIVVRILLFPLVVKSQKNAAKMNNNLPQMQALQLKLTEARQSGNQMMAAKYGHDLMTFMKEKDVNPMKSMLVPLAMAPVFISFFIGLRKMANLPLESMKEGGLFWFTDLTIADPYYLLPLMTCTTLWITLEVGADGVKMNQQHGHLLKYIMRALPIICFPFTMNFPAALLCYWFSSNTISLVQVSILKIPAVRAKLGIEPLLKFTPDALPIKKKGFVDSVKDSWTNVKITKELQERERYDETSFRRAGRGPLPKTYKYDPTKVQKQTPAVGANALRK